MPFASNIKKERIVKKLSFFFGLSPIHESALPTISNKKAYCKLCGTKVMKKKN